MMDDTEDIDAVPPDDEPGHEPNDETIRSIRQFEAGETTRHEDVDDMFRKLGIPPPTPDATTED